MQAEYFWSIQEIARDLIAKWRSIKLLYALFHFIISPFVKMDNCKFREYLTFAYSVRIILKIASKNCNMLGKSKENE